MATDGISISEFFFFDQLKNSGFTVSTYPMREVDVAFLGNELEDTSVRKLALGFILELEEHWVFDVEACCECWKKFQVSMGPLIEW